MTKENPSVQRRSYQFKGEGSDAGPEYSVDFGGHVIPLCVALHCISVSVYGKFNQRGKSSWIKLQIGIQTSK